MNSWTTVTCAGMSWSSASILFLVFVFREISAVRPCSYKLVGKTGRNFVTTLSLNSFWVICWKSEHLIIESFSANNLNSNIESSVESKKIENPMIFFRGRVIPQRKHSVTLLPPIPLFDLLLYLVLRGVPRRRYRQYVFIFSKIGKGRLRKGKYKRTACTSIMGKSLSWSVFRK